MADLSQIANTGQDPTTGEYLSPEQRKKLFRRRKMSSPLNKNVIDFSFGKEYVDAFNRGGGSSIVQQLVPPEKEEENQKVKEQGDDQLKQELSGIRTVSHEILKVKKERTSLNSKFNKFMLQSTKRTEKRKDPEGKKRTLAAPKILQKTAGLFGGIFGLLGNLLAFKVLEWIGDPKNKKAVETFVKGFSMLFKFFDFYIGTMLDNLIGGFADLVGGDNILERIGGLIKLFGGVLMLRWLNPFKLIKDLKFVFKNFGNIRKIFTSLFKFDFKGALGGFNKILAGMGGIFKRGIGRVVKRLLLKVFGKGLTKITSSLFKTAVRGATKLFKKVPIIGPIIGFGINLALGDPVGKAAFKAVAGALVGFIGGAIGSLIPGPGTIVGGILGGIVGDALGGMLYDAIFGKDEKKKKEDTPELSEGGVVSGSEKGFLAVLHGTEVVIPIKKIGEILTTPFTFLAKSLIGSIFGLIDSLGSIGSFVKPIASTMLAPLIALFGNPEEIAFTTEVGKVKDTSQSAQQTTEEKKKIDERGGEYKSRPTAKKSFFESMVGGMKNFIEGTGGFFSGVLENLTKAAGSKPSTPSQGNRSDPSSPAASQQSPGGSKQTPGNTSSAGGQWKPLLELIAAYESVGGSYDSIYPGSTKPGLSQMTIAEADAWQASTAGQRGSAAAGRYQFMYIKDQAAAAGIGPNELFSPENQDKMAIALIEKKRGVTLDMVKNDPDEAMIRLGMEWAALPMPKTMKGHRGMVNAGQSYYAGDGKNAAHVSVAEVKSVFAKMGADPAKTAQQPQTQQSQALTPPPPGAEAPQRENFSNTRSGAQAFQQAQRAFQSQSSAASPTSVSTQIQQPSQSQQSKSTMVNMSTESSYAKRRMNRRGGSAPVIIHNQNVSNQNTTVSSLPINTSGLTDTTVLNRL